MTCNGLLSRDIAIFYLSLHPCTFPQNLQNMLFPLHMIVLVFQIEAMVLGSLAWRSDSPLFNAIEEKGSVPSYEEVNI